MLMRKYIFFILGIIHWH